MAIEKLKINYKTQR